MRTRRPLMSVEDTKVLKQTSLITGVLISPQPDQEGNQLIFLSEWGEFPSVPCLAGKTLNSSRLHVVVIARVPDMLPSFFSFLVGLRTYQHPCKQPSISQHCLSCKVRSISSERRHDCLLQLQLQPTATANSCSQQLQPTATANSYSQQLQPTATAKSYSQQPTSLNAATCFGVTRRQALPQCRCDS